MKKLQMKLSPVVYAYEYLGMLHAAAKYDAANNTWAAELKDCASGKFAGPDFCSHSHANSSIFV